MSSKQGFALIGVLVLVVMITTFVPMLFVLAGDTSEALQREEQRARLHSEASHALMLGHASLLGNEGAPYGWQRVSGATTEMKESLASCRYFIGADKRWDTSRVTLSLTSLDRGSRIFTAIYDAQEEGIPYPIYEVLGCAISSLPIAGAVVMQGRFAHIDGAFLPLNFAIGGS